MSGGGTQGYNGYSQQPQFFPSFGSNFAGPGGFMPGGFQGTDSGFQTKAMNTGPGATYPSTFAGPGGFMPGGMQGTDSGFQTGRIMDTGGSMLAPTPQPAYAPQVNTGYTNQQLSTAMQGYGLDPNSASGQQWSQAIQSGQATTQDMLKALSSGQANQNFGQPVTSPPPPPSPMQTKGIVLSEGLPGSTSQISRPLNYFPGPGTGTGPGTGPGPSTGGGPSNPPPGPTLPPNGQVPYNPYPGFPGLPPMPADNTPRWYGPQYMNNSITARLFQNTPQIAQYMDALANNPNSFRFS